MVTRIPAEAAELMYEQFVDGPSDSITTGFPHMSDGKKVAYRDKERLYRVSSVMLSILSCDGPDGKFSDVRERFEHLIFGLAPTERAEEFLRSHLVAMDELQKLSLSSDRQLSWARGWLASIDIDVVSPIELGSFVHSWLRHMYYSRSALIEIGKAGADIDE